ncbi:MAG TPA: dTMP kinase [Candidatus Nitrosopolaris sp.]
MRKGKIIVLEGIDKAGKSTQSKLLMDYLKLSGKICTLITFPDYTTSIGAEIKAFLEGKRDYPIELKHILLSANRWEKKKEIESMVDSGTIVIINRYYQSNLVYGTSNGLNLRWLLSLEKGLPTADLVIVLDVTPRITLKRSLEPDEFEKDVSLLQNVYKNYHKLAKPFRWKILNAEKSRDQIHDEVKKTVERIIKV